MGCGSSNQVGPQPAGMMQSIIDNKTITLKTKIVTHFNIFNLHFFVSSCVKGPFINVNSNEAIAKS